MHIAEAQDHELDVDDDQSKADARGNQANQYGNEDDEPLVQPTKRAADNVHLQHKRAVDGHVDKQI